MLSQLRQASSSSSLSLSTEGDRNAQLVSRIYDKYQSSYLTESLYRYSFKVLGTDELAVVAAMKRDKSNLQTQLMERLERLKRRGGLYKQQQRGLEAKLNEAIKAESKAIKESQEQLKPIQQEMQKLQKTVMDGVRKMERNTIEDVQQLRQELKGDSNQVIMIQGDLNQTVISLNMEIPLAKEVGNALGKGLEIIGDMMRGGAYSLLKNLWSKLKGIFR